MRLNESELISSVAFQSPEWEGRLSYKAPGRGGGFRAKEEYKDRWFRLKSNFLFYWRIGNSSSGGGGRPQKNAEPMGVRIEA